MLFALFQGGIERIKATASLVYLVCSGRGTFLEP